MPSSQVEELPNVADILVPLLERVPREEQPLLIAIAERLAAQRYRAWAGELSNAEQRSELLACADREEEIASRVEALYPDAAAIQGGIRAKSPDLDEVNRTLFATRPLAQQFAIQAQGERLGAATWRSFVRQDESGARRETLLACAELEEENARALEALLAADH